MIFLKNFNLLKMEPIESTGMNKQIDLASLSDNELLDFYMKRNPSDLMYNDDEDYMKQVREYYKIDIAYSKVIKQIFDAIKEGKIRDAGLINHIKYIFGNEDIILHEMERIARRSKEE